MVRMAEPMRPCSAGERSEQYTGRARLGLLAGGPRHTEDWSPSASPTLDKARVRARRSLLGPDANVR
jgi:hypothetical protein